MAVTRIDHVAVAVRNLDETLPRYLALGAELITRKKGLENGSPVEVAYLRLGESVLTLVQPGDDEGFIARFLARRGEGLHHLGVETDDLDAFVRDLEAAGVRIPVREEIPGHRREVILSPRDFGGVVLQVIQWLRPAASMEERVRRYQDFEFPQEDQGG